MPSTKNLWTNHNSLSEAPMQLVAALVYWLIVALWLCVLAGVALAYWRNPRTFGAVRVLLAVLAIDTVRNIVENIYFGLYFGAQYGLFPSVIASVLGRPHFLILPKAINVAASLGVLGILLLRWLPNATVERTDADAALSDAERRFKLLVDGVKEYAVYLLDPTGRVTSWNTGAERINGYAAAEIIGEHFSRFYTSSDQNAGVPARALGIAERDGHFETRARRVRKDGTTFWANVVIEPIRSSKGALVGFAKVTKDITEEIAAEENLRYLALFDQLTGLPNRVSLLADLTAELEAGKANDTSLALVDLDRFKDTNDTLGHEVGDQILLQIAARLAFVTSQRGTLYRIGGDTFALLSRGDPRALAPLVDAMLSAVEECLEVEGRRLFMSASAGIAVPHEERDQSPHTLMADADLALHDAKQEGGRRSGIFAAAMRAQATARQEIETELRRAFGEGEFVLHYQPQVRLVDKSIVGAEALLRWQHRTRGLLAPAAFIDALAASPIAASVGNWVLRESILQASTWLRAGLGPVRIGVNLFPAQFHDPAIVDVVATGLREANLPSPLLELEITENIALRGDRATLATLDSLHDLGVGLAFDDFGTGYASLSYLIRYPLTRIKIDRSFVSKVDETGGLEAAVTRSIVAMAHNLGLRAIAEGVESEAQARFLLSANCEEGQGYLYGKAIPPSAFTEILQARPVGRNDTEALDGGMRLSARGIGLAHFNKARAG